MAFPFVAVLISAGVSFALGQLRPRVKKPKPQDLEGWKAEEGLPVPYLAGIGPVEGNVVWYGDVFYARHNDELVTAYHVNILMRLCQGPINEILDFQAGGKSIRFQVPHRDQDSSHDATTVISPALPFVFSSDAAADFDINARQMFGGLEREGGLEHRVRVYPGSLTQNVIDELTSRGWAAAGLVDPGEGTARPGICYAAFGQDPDLTPDRRFYVGTIAQPKSFVWILTRYPRGLLDLGLDAVYTNPNTGESLSYTSPVIGFDSNPAEILYELSVDQRLGLRMSPNAIDLPSLVRGGALWQREQFGQSVYLTRKEEGKAILDELLKALRSTYTPHPVTGLLTLTPLRGDYAIGSVLTVSDNPGAANAWDLEEVTPLAGDSPNQVQLNYRRFAGAVNGTIVGEQLTSAFRPSFGGIQFLNTKGKNISNVVVRIGATELTIVVDYSVHAAQGLIVIAENDTTEPLIGQPVEADYLSNPETMRFEEAHVTEHLLGEQLRTGGTRVLEMEAPYTTSDLVAAKIAAATKLDMSRTPRQYRWKMNRQGYALYPGAVCKITSSRLGLVDLAVRVGDVDQGTLENPVIEVIAVEDLYAEDVLESLPPAGGGPDGVRTQAPAMAIACGIGGAGVSRIALFASDALYDIEVWEADDAIGTGATLVATVAGSTLFHDGTVGKYYRARQIQPDGLADPGPFTAWITCAAVDEDPEDPACVEPTYLVTADEVAGTVTLTVADPQGRVRTLEFRHRSGAGSWSEWTADTAPYVDTVTLDPVEASRIEWQITYQTCGGANALLEGGHDFEAGPPEEEEPPDFGGLTEVPIEIVLLGADQTSRYRGIPAEATPFDGTGASQTKFPLGQFIAARVVRSAESSTLPEGAAAFAAYEHPDDPDLLLPLDGSDGPSIAMDAASVAADPNKAVEGEWRTITPEARQDVRLRGMWLGGDGEVLKGIVSPRVVLQLIAQDVGTAPPPETPGDPPDDPGDPPAVSCVDDTMPYAAKLFGWYLGDCGTFDLVSAPDLVLTLTDLSGNGNTLTSVGAIGSVYWGTDVFGNPILLNGRKGANFNASTMKLPDMFTGKTDVTMVVVAKSLNGDGTLGNPGASNFIYSWKLGVSGFAEDPIYSGAQFVGGFKKWFDDFGSTTYREVGTIDNPDQAQIRTMQSATGKWRATVDGVEVEDSGTNTVGWPTAPVIGNFGQNSDLVIWELAFFEGLTELELNDVIANVGERWGISESSGGNPDGDGGGDTGAGPDGDDPIPDPPPGGWPPPVSGGARPFGAHNIPIAGLSFWNSTIKVTNRTNINSLVAAAGTGSPHAMLVMGNTQAWLDGSGRFSYDRWEAFAESVAADSVMNDAINDHMGDAAWAHYVIDEPNHLTRYGGPIPLAVVERMCLKSKALWPLWRTVVRIRPTHPWLTRAIAGCDTLWAEYLLARGPVEVFRRQEIEAALSLDVDLIFGVHYMHFERADSDDDRFITPSELRHYGGILASPDPAYPSFRTVAMGGWRYENGLYVQSGFPDSLRYVRDLYASFDP